MRVSFEARILWMDLLCDVETISFSSSFFPRFLQREKRCWVICKNGGFEASREIAPAGCRDGGYILESESEEREWETGELGRWEKK